MAKLYKQGDDLSFTYSDLRDMFYQQLEMDAQSGIDHGPYVLYTTAAGLVYSWDLLANLKERYNVSEPDPDKALAICEVIAVQPRPDLNAALAMIDDVASVTVENTVAIDDTQTQIDLMAGAIEELIALQFGE